VLRRGISTCKPHWHVLRQRQPRGAVSGCKRTAIFCSDGIGLSSERRHRRGRVESVLQGVLIHQYRDTSPEAAVKQTQRGEDSCFSQLDYFGKHKHDPGECSGCASTITCSCSKMNSLLKNEACQDAEFRVRFFFCQSASPSLLGPRARRLHTKALPPDTPARVPGTRRQCRANYGPGAPRGCTGGHWGIFFSTKWRLFHCRQPPWPSWSRGSHQGVLWGSPHRKYPLLGVSNRDCGPQALCPCSRLGFIVPYRAILCYVCSPPLQRSDPSPFDYLAMHCGSSL
jgi:hypothetical protein